MRRSSFGYVGTDFLTPPTEAQHAYPAAKAGEGRQTPSTLRTVRMTRSTALSCIAG